MTAPVTAYKLIALPEQSVTTTWGDALNTGPFADLDKCLGGIVNKTLSNINVALTVAESKNAILRLTGTLTGAVQITTTNQGFTLVENATTGAYAVTFINAATYGGGTIGIAVTIPQGHKTVVVSDTTNGCRLWSTSYIDDLGTAGVIKRSSTGVVTTDSGTTAIGFAKDNSGAVLGTGIQGDILIPFACTITAVTLLADQTGSMVVDLWKLGYTSFPPTVGNSICASALPTISSASKYDDTTLTGWTTAISANDTIRININSCSTITRFSLILNVSRY
jgi:hypothetical protein